MKKFCCEEMREFAKSFKNKEGANRIGNFSVFFENESPEEMALGEFNSPNILFRFCPYCGAAMTSKKVEKTGNIVVDRITDIVFKKDLDEYDSSPSCRLAILEETVEKVREILQSGIPA